MKLTVENVLNEVEQTPAEKKKVKSPKKTKEPVTHDEPETEDNPDLPDETSPASDKSKAVILIIFIAGMLLFAFMGYMVFSNLNLSGDKSTKPVEIPTTESTACSTESAADDATPKDEQIKKLTDENKELKAQLEAEKQRTANGGNYDKTVQDLNDQLKAAQDALAASEAREKALQAQLNGTAVDK